MHPSAMAHGGLFFRTYVDALPAPQVLDLGALDVFGSLRAVAPAHARYVGADLTAGAGVDVVLQDPYVLPFADASFDAVVTSSCLEHAEFFWLTVLEIMRVLRPHGVAYINVPSNGEVHRYPVDCWRFYPDSGRALARWARRHGHPAVLLESFVGEQAGDQWNDFVCVLLRDEATLARHPRRMLHSLGRYTNGLCHPDLETFRHPQRLTQDQQRLHGPAGGPLL